MKVQAAGTSCDTCLFSFRILDDVLSDPVVMQDLVRPPGTQAGVGSRTKPAHTTLLATSAEGQPATLTGPPFARLQVAFVQEHICPAFGGGEKVRLCAGVIRRLGAGNCETGSAWSVWEQSAVAGQHAVFQRVHWAYGQRTEMRLCQGTVTRRCALMPAVHKPC